MNKEQQVAKNTRDKKAKKSKARAKRLKRQKVIRQQRKGKGKSKRLTIAQAMLRIAVEQAYQSETFDALSGIGPDGPWATKDEWLQARLDEWEDEAKGL